MRVMTGRGVRGHDKDEVKGNDQGVVERGIERSAILHRGHQSGTNVGRDGIGAMRGGERRTVLASVVLRLRNNMKDDTVQ